MGEGRLGEGSPRAQTRPGITGGRKSLRRDPASHGPKSGAADNRLSWVLVRHSRAEDEDARRGPDVFRGRIAAMTDGSWKGLIVGRRRAGQAVPIRRATI